MVGAFLKPSCGRGCAPIHSIPNSVAHRWRAVYKYYSYIIRGAVKEHTIVFNRSPFLHAFYVSFVKKDKKPLTPQECRKADLCGLAFFLLFGEVFIQIMTNRNEKYLECNRFYPSADNPFIVAVIFQYAKCALSLNGPVHP